MGKWRGKHPGASSHFKIQPTNIHIRPPSTYFGCSNDLSSLIEPSIVLVLENMEEGVQFANGCFPAT
jgi:hypothetical protein